MLDEDQKECLKRETRRKWTRLTTTGFAAARSHKFPYPKQNSMQTTPTWKKFVKAGENRLEYNRVLHNKTWMKIKLLKTEEMRVMSQMAVMKRFLTHCMEM